MEYFPFLALTLLQKGHFEVAHPRMYGFERGFCTIYGVSAVEKVVFAVESAFDF
jgi:hypothetical protein